MSLQSSYEAMLLVPTDIQAHLPKLHELAHGKKVVEFGVRSGLSTIAMLSAHPSHLYSYDLVLSPEVEAIIDLAEEEGAPFTFFQKDIDQLPLIPQCEFVFCDAMHNAVSVFIQLNLALAAGATKIALHDTETFGVFGDVPENGGIMQAVERFLHQNPVWKTLSHSPEDNGFTVLHSTQ